MTRCPARRLALITLVVSTLALPAIVAAQSASPAPGGSALPGQSVAPGQSATPAPSAAPGVPATPSDAWSIAVCTAYARIKDAPAALAALGQAALAGDEDAMSVAAITAGLLGDDALRALETLDGTWEPGAAFAGFLTATGYALVDVGVALAETDLTNPDPLRTALGNALAAEDGWSHIGDEVTRLRDATGFDCAGVPVPSPEPVPSAAPATPEPSYLGDSELESRFPAQIAGQTVTPDSRTGAELAASVNPDDAEAQARLQAVDDALAASGRTIDDVSVAFAYVPTEDGFGASITAFRVRGGDAAALLEGLVPLITIDYTGVQRATVTVDGRDLIKVSDTSDPTNVFEVLVPSGDTIWAVSADEPVLTEIVMAFPG